MIYSVFIWGFNIHTFGTDDRWYFFCDHVSPELALARYEEDCERFLDRTSVEGRLFLAPIVIIECQRLSSFSPKYTLVYCRDTSPDMLNKLGLS